MELWHVVDNKTPLFIGVIQTQVLAGNISASHLIELWYVVDNKEPQLHTTKSSPSDYNIV